MKKINILLFILTSIIMSGCTTINTSPVTMKKVLKNDDLKLFEKAKLEKKYQIKVIPNKTSFFSLIKHYNKTNPYKKLIILDKIKKDFTLKYPYTFEDIRHFIDYVNGTMNKNINITRIDGKIYKLNEPKDPEIMFKEDYLVNTSSLDFVDIPLKLNGEISYYDILQIIQKDFHIPIILKGINTVSNNNRFYNYNNRSYNNINRSYNNNINRSYNNNINNSYNNNSNNNKSINNNSSYNNIINNNKSINNKSINNSS